MQSSTFVALIPVAGFAIVGSFTPGPNTMIAASIGAQNGWKAAWPHAFGVAVGFSSMLLLAAMGVVGALWLLPQTELVLRVIGALYMCWCAWGIATSGTDGTSLGGPSSFTFVRSVGFQYLNPKGWMLAMAATSMYAQSMTSTFAMGALLICAIASVSSIMCWSMVGTGLSRWLTTSRRRLAFNWTAGFLLLATAGWMLLMG
jgi:threonine/homoserine/homoserine lactone efflux protein